MATMTRKKAKAAPKESTAARNSRFEAGLLKAAKRGNAGAGVTLRRVLTSAIYAVLPGKQQRRHIDEQLEMGFRAARDAVSRKVLK